MTLKNEFLWNLFSSGFCISGMFSFDAVTYSAKDNCSFGRTFNSNYNLLLPVVPVVSSGSGVPIHIVSFSDSSKY